MSEVGGDSGTYAAAAHGELWGELGMKAGAAHNESEVLGGARFGVW